MANDYKYNLIKHGTQVGEEVKGLNATLLGASHVFVGVETDNDKVYRTEDGYNYVANEVVGKKIYDMHKLNHKNWFILDLETGTRDWYPGIELEYNLSEEPTPVAVESFVVSKGFKDPSIYYSLTVKALWNSETLIWHNYYPKAYNKDLCYKIGYIVKYKTIYETEKQYKYYKCILDITVPEKDFDFNKWELIDPIDTTIWQNDNLRYAP